MQLADRRVAEWLFLLAFAVYAYFYAGGGWNQNATFDLTRAMVERHTLAIDAYAGNTGDVSYANGHVYANKAPALAWLAAVPYALMRGLPISLAIYLCTLVCVAIPGALIPPMLYSAGRRRGVDARWCATVALTTAFATLLFPYATIFMVAVPSGALMLYACTGERRAFGGFAVGLAIAMNYLAVAALLFGRRVRFFVAAAIPLIALAVYQWMCFGSPFKTSVATTDPRFLTHGSVFVAPSLAALVGITISPYRGLFFFAPVLLLAIPRLRDWRIAAVAAFFLAANVCFNGWEGGFAVGARYLVPVIPLLGVGLLSCRGWTRKAVVALGVVSFAINFAAAAVDPQPSGTIPRPFTQYIVPLLLHGRFSPDVPITPPWSAATITGHTSVNRLTHDEATLFQRYPPQSPQVEWASFNLGELAFGPGDARSLIPIALLLAAGGAAIAWRVRQVPRS
ncbi:MAG TPA: hypothetical protein VJZ76_12025 [Thermoanaerobaculia bacterium]|nr:hypothetical protein [Thermoanaerobaculia bacterium]